MLRTQSVSSDEPGAPTERGMLSTRDDASRDRPPPAQCLMLLVKALPPTIQRPIASRAVAFVAVTMNSTAAAARNAAVAKTRTFAPRSCHVRTA